MVQLFLLTSHWLELSHMTASNHTGACEMWSNVCAQKEYGDW